MNLTADVTDKIVAAAVDSKTAAEESAKTNEKLDDAEKKKRIQWYVTLAGAVALIAGATTSVNDIKHNQADTAVTLANHGKRMDGFDTRFDKVDVKIDRLGQDTSFIKGVLQKWDAPQSQPTMSARK